jgi:hypothetical protein
MVVSESGPLALELFTDLEARMAEVLVRYNVDELAEGLW